MRKKRARGGGKQKIIVDWPNIGLKLPKFLKIDKQDPSFFVSKSTNRDIRRYHYTDYRYLKDTPLFSRARCRKTNYGVLQQGIMGLRVRDRLFAMGRFFFPTQNLQLHSCACISQRPLHSNLRCPHHALLRHADRILTPPLHEPTPRKSHPHYYTIPLTPLRWGRGKSQPEASLV